jgi:Mg2+ and Co2+ transporter CorA
MPPMIEEVEDFPPTVLVISFGRFKREDELTITHTRDGQVVCKLKFTQSIKLDSFWRDLTDAHNREVDRSKRTHSKVIINTIGSMRSDLTEMKEKVGSFQDLIDKALSNAEKALELSNQANEAMNESNVKYQDTVFQMLSSIQLMQSDISNFMENIETSETKTLFGQRLIH